jgi:hypothetical protein
VGALLYILARIMKEVDPGVSVKVVTVLSTKVVLVLTLDQKLSKSKIASILQKKS